MEYMGPYSTVRIPLFLRIYIEEMEIVIKLLSSWKCNPNIQNRNGDTPLHIAARENETGALSQLLHHKYCNLNVQNMKGDTPLHIAVTIGNLKLCEMIMTNVK